MPSELGRLEKPSADQYREQRKIYLVPLLFAPTEPSPDFADLLERYWTGVREHLLKLETSIGSVARVYHEMVGKAGEEGLAMAERVNVKSASIARGKVEAGASLEAVEDQDLVAESFDWQRCLLAGLESRKVTEQVWGFFSEAMRQRYETMSKRIEESLKPAEAGLLFISEDHRVQFPPDVRVFYVAPPALDEVHRWLREERTRGRKEEGKETDR